MQFNSSELYDLSLLDLSYLTKEQQGKEVERLAKEVGLKSFDLFNDLLIRSRLLKLNEEEHILLLTIHHIVFDGWSMGVFVEELTYFYEACSKGNSFKFEELPIQYVDFAVWQRQWLQGERLQEQLLYWKEKLVGDLPVLKLPTDYPRPPIQTFTGGKCSIVIPAELSKKIKDLADTEETTLFMMLLSAFKVLLHQYSKQEDIIVGTLISNRGVMETEKLIGCFLNTLVLRTELYRGIRFGEVLARVKKITLEAYNNQDLPIEKLVEELDPKRSLSHTPLFQVLFNMLNFKIGEMKLPELTVSPIISSESSSKFDMTLYAEEKEDGIYLDLVYKADLFSKERMVDMLKHYRLLLEEITKNPEIRINSLPLPAEKYRAMLVESLEQSKVMDSLEHIEPLTEMEKVIAEIWREVLELKEISVYDDFFELGGHSYLLVQIHSKLCMRMRAKVLNYNIALVDLFKYPTIYSLAKYLSNMQDI